MPIMILSSGLPMKVASRMRGDTVYRLHCFNVPLVDEKTDAAMSSLIARTVCQHVLPVCVPLVVDCVVGCPPVFLYDNEIEVDTLTASTELMKFSSLV